MPNPHPALDFWVVYLNYTDLFGDSITEESLVATLKTFKRTEILVLLSKIGLVLQNDRTQFWYTPNVQTFLIAPFLDPDSLKRLRDEVQRLNKEHPDEKWLAVFSEFQIVNLMKIAILHTNDEEGSGISTEEERFRFGKCCLMMNNLLSPAVPNPTKDNKEQVREKLMEEVIRNHLFQDNENFQHGFVRAHELFWEIPTQLKTDPQFFDIPAAFEKATGFSIPEYLGIGFSFWSWWSEVTLSTVASSSHIAINPGTFFQNVRKNRNKCNDIIGQFSLPADEYKNALQDEQVSLSDNWQFRYSNIALEQYPLLETGGVLVCLSMKFLSRKLTRNLFYSINNSLSYKDSERFRTFFGRVFEEYVRRLLRRCFESRCKIERYSTEQVEAGEAILVYPRVLIIVEAKSSRPSLNVVRLGDLKTFRDTVERIVVRACVQIDRVIKDFRARKFTISGTSPYDIGRLYPLIVTIQSFPQDPLTCSEIEKLVYEEGVLQEESIAPYTLISISELEQLEPLLQTTSMVDVLGQKTGDPGYRTMSMNNFVFSFYKRLGPSDWMRKRFREIGEFLMSLLFTKEEIEDSEFK